MILSLAIVCNIITTIFLLAGVSEREDVGTEDLRELLAGILCLVHVVVYIIIAVIINKKDTRRGGIVVRR